MNVVRTTFQGRIRESITGQQDAFRRDRLAKMDDNDILTQIHIHVFGATDILHHIDLFSGRHIAANGAVAQEFIGGMD